MKNSTAIIAMEFTTKLWSIVLICAAITSGCQQKEVRVEVPIEKVKTNTVFVTNTVIQTNTVFLTNTVVRTNTQMVTNIVRVTNELVKEFPLVAKKIVPVRAPIPKEYQTALEIVDSMRSAKAAKKPDELLQGISGVRVVAYVSEKLENKLSKDALQNKIEFKLRQAGIKVDTESPYWLSFTVEGFWDEMGIRANYSVNLELTEAITVTRNSPAKAVRTVVPTWRKGTHGFAGANVLESSTMNNADTFAEAFANAFLAQNPK